MPPTNPLLGIPDGNRFEIVKEGRIQFPDVTVDGGSGDLVHQALDFELQSFNETYDFLPFVMGSVFSGGVNNLLDLYVPTPQTRMLPSSAGNGVIIQTFSLMVRPSAVCAVHQVVQIGIDTVEETVDGYEAIYYILRQRAG